MVASVKKPCGKTLSDSRIKTGVPLGIFLLYLGCGHASPQRIDAVRVVKESKDVPEKFHCHFFDGLR